MTIGTDGGLTDPERALTQELTFDPVDAPGDDQSDAAREGYGRGLVLVTVASMLAPLVGIAGAPLLAQNLGVGGRGEFAAAMAPMLITIELVYLGLPDALTYHVAKRPDRTRHLLAVACLLSLPLAGLGVLAVWFSSPWLSGGNADLAQLMSLVVLASVPTVFVSMLRGAALGRQMWTMTAAERGLVPVVKLVGFIALALTGTFTLVNALAVALVAPVVGGLAYARLLRPVPVDTTDLEPVPTRAAVRRLMGYGSQVYLGGLAIMLMARTAELAITPLSTVDELGLFVVAVTIAGIPWVLTETTSKVVFGANSAERRDREMLATASIGFWLASLSSLFMGATLPWWIEPVFGADFSAAVVPTWILLFGASIMVPAQIAAMALSAAGRPALRSASLVGALIGFMVLLFVLTPTLGALGGAIANAGSTFVALVICMLFARAQLGVRIRDFFFPRSDDVRAVTGAIVKVGRKLTGR